MAAINLLRLSLNVQSVQVRATSLCTEVIYYSPGLLYLPCPLPCLCTLPPACDPCPMSRSAVTLSRRVSASASASPSSQSRCCQYAPAAGPPALPSSASAITPAVARPHTSTLALLQLQLSILCVAESSEVTARRGGVGASTARLLHRWQFRYALESVVDEVLGVDCEYPSLVSMCAGIAYHNHNLTCRLGSYR